MIGEVPDFHDAAKRALVRLDDGREGVLTYYPATERRPLRTGRRARKPSRAHVKVGGRTIYVDPLTLIVIAYPEPEETP